MIYIKEVYKNNPSQSGFFGNFINLIKMKKLIAYTIEMHKQDPECIPLALVIILMFGIGFTVLAAVILSAQ